MDFNSYKKVISNCNHIVKVGMVSAYALFLGANTALASVTEYMDQKVSLKTQNCTIESVIQQIEKQTDYLFVYDKNDVDVKRTVYVNGSNTDVIELLKGIFANTDIDCKVLGNNITLSKISNVATRIAQQTRQEKKTAKGNVIDSTGEPVIGASVVEQGTTNGTVTDINGNFTLNLSTPNAKIEISFIGYKTQVLAAQSGKLMAVKLVDDTELLDEVVVVGYGSQKKVNMTGAVATIDSKTLASRPISNISQGLQGLAPGVTVTNAGGQPGQDTGKILIRGLGSFNASSPMVLIDGVEGDMNVVDPNDIESISVLKDASSAAIYGSKAANGVILITTKRGQSGKPNLTYSALFGWSKPADLMDRTTSAELAELTNEAEYWDAISQGASPEQAEKRKPYTQEDIRKYAEGSDPYGHPNTDWYDLFYTGSGFMNRHNIGMSGGSEWAKYRASLGYVKQEGIVENASNRQFNVRTNLDLKLTERLKSRINLDFANTLMKEPTDPISWSNGDAYQVFRQVNRISPMVPYKNEDGTYGAIADGNPIAFQDLGSTGDTDKDYLNAFAEFSYDIWDGLKITANGSYNIVNRSYKLYRKDLQYNANKYDGPIRLTKSHTKEIRRQGDILLNYDKTFAQKHTVNALAGFHTELYSYEYDDAYRQDFPSSDVTDMNGGSVVGMRNSGYTRELAMNSVFSRLKYNYRDKYLFEANVRSDGSSRFAEGNRWGWFPSFSGAWRITNEDFVLGTAFNEVVTDMKVRGSWGMLGNQQIGNDYYPYINTYATNAKYPFDNKVSGGAVQTENKIQDISWEKTTTWGAAVDMTLFNELQVTLEYYNRKTTGILMQVNVPNTYGYPGYWDNVGAMRNQGLEVSLAWHKTLGEVQLNFAGNFTYNKNEILSLGNVDVQKDSRTIRMVGKEFNAFYGYKSDGIFQNKEEIANAPKYTMISNDRLIPGDIKLVDINEDGEINPDDKVILSSENPKYTFAFNLGARWKMFDLNLFFQGAAGVSRYFTDEFYGEFNGDSGHPSNHWLGRWTPEKPTNKWPRASKFRTYNLPETTCSDFWLVNTNYLRLKDIQVGFNVPKEWLQAVHLGSARIYYSGTNLLTFSKTPQGIDPEAPAGWGAYYPHVKTHSIGINITL